MQFHCVEAIDYTNPNPADKITNLAFSLFFDETDKGSYFTDTWYVVEGEKQSPFFLGLDEKDGPIKKDTEFELHMMKSLHIAQIIPPDENKTITSFHYKGSGTKPPCDENIYWFVYENILDIKSNTITHMKELFLED